MDTLVDGLEARIAGALWIWVPLLRTPWSIALLHQCGMALPLIERELAAMAEVEIAKTSNRRVVGTTNELAFEAGVYRERVGATDLARLSMRLAQTPFGAIGHNSPDRLMLEVVRAYSLKKPTFAQ